MQGNLSNTLLKVLGVCAALLVAGCSGSPTQAYYHGQHVAPNQTGYVSSPYYSHARTKQYVSSYPSEMPETTTNAPYQRHYVSAQGHQGYNNAYGQQSPQAYNQPYEIYGAQTNPQAADTYKLQQWGFVHHRTMGENNYFVLRNVNHQINLERALENVPDGQTVELGQTTRASSGYPLLFTPNSPIYRTSRTGEYCREVFLEMVDHKPLRGIFCSQDNVPWALMR